jgi:hypothetical protein
VTLEEKIEEIENRLFAVHSGFEVYKINMERRFSDVQDNIQSNVALVNEKIESLKATVRDLAIGDGHAPYVEVFFFIVGTIMSTYSDEFVDVYELISRRGLVV